MPSAGSVQAIGRQVVAVTIGESDLKFCTRNPDQRIQIKGDTGCKLIGIPDRTIMIVATVQVVGRLGDIIELEGNALILEPAALAAPVPEHVIAIRIED